MNFLELGSPGVESVGRRWGSVLHTVRTHKVPYRGKSDTNMQIIYNYNFLYIVPLLFL